MKTLYSNSSFLHTARKLLITIPVYFLLQFSSYFNKANANVLISQVYTTNGVAGTTDKNVLTQKEFYRLKMTDESGVVTYSSVVVVTNESKTKFIAQLYPTIVSKQLSITISGSENITYNIIAIDGKILKTGNIPANRSQLEIGDFAQGQYFVHLKNKQGEIQVLRFVKK